MAVASLPTTCVSLLTQLRQDPSDQAGWDEFVERYGRHIYRWCRQWKLQDADAEDVTQDILVKLTQKLRAFAYDPSRSFRGWPSLLPLSPALGSQYETESGCLKLSPSQRNTQ